jgi:hypothetical protein
MHKKYSKAFRPRWVRRGFVAQPKVKRDRPLIFPPRGYDLMVLKSLSSKPALFVLTAMPFLAVEETIRTHGGEILYQLVVHAYVLLAIWLAERFGK